MEVLVDEVGADVEVLVEAGGDDSGVEAVEAGGRDGGVGDRIRERFFEMLPRVESSRFWLEIGGYCCRE